MARLSVLALLLFGPTAASAEELAATCDTEGGCEDVALAQLKHVQLHVNRQNNTQESSCDSQIGIDFVSLCNAKFDSTVCTADCSSGSANGWVCNTCSPANTPLDEGDTTFAGLVQKVYGCCPGWSKPHGLNDCYGWHLKPPTGNACD